MELRKDPITQSWVIQVDGEGSPTDGRECPLCPGHESSCPQNVYEYPYGSPDWQVRVIPHLKPLYRIEGDAQRRAEGLYDRMRNLGAHEIVIEHRDHNLPLAMQSDENVAHVLRAYVTRIRELKGDRRFRYVTVFRNQGREAGQDLAHPHSEITATPFVPRRVAYELRSAKQYFRLKERCLLCDIISQELNQQVRTVEWDDQFMAFCPFASRVPYETWVLPVSHHASFEEHLATWESQLRLARFLKSVLRRVGAVAPAHHLVLLTTPNTNAKFEKGNWETLMDDSHWHFEILPVIPSQFKSYGLKEVYYNSLLPEKAAAQLRNIEPAAEARA